MAWFRRSQRSAQPPPGDEQEARDRAHVSLQEHELTFHVDNPLDVVQKVLLKGRFYEHALLRYHRDFIFNGSTVLDVGANIGNHTVFYALSGAAKVYPFEPNPRANRLLARTIATNKLSDTVDLTYLEYGIGDVATTLGVHTANENNLGRTVLSDDSDVRVEVRPLDDFEFAGRISLIKIDVEGMEIPALTGAAKTVARHRPVVAVEVDDSNAEQFWDWVQDTDYQVVRMVRRHQLNADYVCIPRGAVPAWTRSASL